MAQSLVRLLCEELRGFSGPLIASKLSFAVLSLPPPEQDRGTPLPQKPAEGTVLTRADGTQNGSCHPL